MLPPICEEGEREGLDESNHDVCEDAAGVTVAAFLLLIPHAHVAGALPSVLMGICRASINIEQTDASNACSPMRACICVCASVHCVCWMLSTTRALSDLRGG